MPIDPERVEAITFDCYGTLIDWESGLLDTLRPWVTSAGITVDDESLLNMYARHEASAEHAGYRPYRDVLRDVGVAMGGELAIGPPAAGPDFLGESVASWPAFPDSAEALRMLATRYRLAIVSNIDDDLIASSLKHLGVTFDEVVTAQQVNAYKPARAHFDEVIRRLGIAKDRVLHAAQSRYHDIAPARALGIATVWVNRQAGRLGATPPADAKPDAEVADMRELAQLLARA